MWFYFSCKFSCFLLKLILSDYWNSRSNPTKKHTKQDLIDSSRQLLSTGKNLLNRIIKNTLDKTITGGSKACRKSNKRLQRRVLQSQEFVSWQIPFEVKQLSPMAKDTKANSRSFKNLGSSKLYHSNPTQLARNQSARFLSRQEYGYRKRPMTSSISKKSYQKFLKNHVHIASKAIIEQSKK